MPVPFIATLINTVVFSLYLREYMRVQQRERYQLSRLLRKRDHLAASGVAALATICSTTLFVLIGNH